MTLSYSLRLVYFSFACFLVVNLAAAIVVRRVSAIAIRRAERMNSSRAADFLLALRLSPAAIGILCVALFCVPSYLWLEPDIAAEDASLLGLIASALGIALWALALLRGIRAAWRTFQFVRACTAAGSQRAGRITVPHAGRLIALAGVFRPRLIVSGDVEAALDPDEFALALRHEQVHRAARDNLKQLLILLSPGLFLMELERAWKRCTEWSADDRAAAGDPESAGLLASALLRVARIRPAGELPALATALLDDQDGLAARVNRLLEPAREGSISRRWAWPILAAGAAITLLTPSALAWVHEILEQLVN